MTPEELLMPRYRVIADYPGNDIKVGKVFEPNIDWPESYLKKYPHLFRKLEWWEERNPEDMPGYVKQINTGVVEKVKGWAGCNSVVEFYDGTEGHISFWLPATETEYLNYKSKQ